MSHDPSTLSHPSALASTATLASAAPGTPGRAAAHRHSSPLPTWAWLVGAAMLAAIVGLTTALVHHAGEEARAQQADPLAQGDPLAQLPPPGAGPGDPDVRLRPGPSREAPLSASALAPITAAPDAPARSTAASRTARTAPPSTGLVDAEAPRSVAAACSTCGTVESVRAVQVAGEGTGLGAVAGGVVGGVVGNQFGKGSGNTAMTVLGAVGGGYAGHQIEKRARSQTVYQVRVRMGDGSLRTVQSSTPWSVGARVRLDNGRLRSDTSAA